MRLKLSFVIILIFAPLLQASNHFIVSGGTGAQTGADWNNALAWLPSNPASCGDSYFLAGGSYNFTGVATTTWTLDCNGSGTVSLYKAVDCGLTAAPYCGTVNPEAIAGWVASYGTAQTLFYQTVADVGNPLAGMLLVCGGNYVLDGVTPLTGTPTTTGFGIKFQSQDRGKIGAGSTSCPTRSGPIVGFTARHIETDSVNPQYGNKITSCTRNGAGTTVTLGLSHDPALDSWIANDKVNIFYTTPTSFNCATSGCTNHIISMTSSTLIYNQNGTPDEVCTTPGLVNLNIITGSGMGAGGASGSSLKGIINVTLTDNYVHDGGQMNCYNCQNFISERNWIARNRSTPAQHANGMQLPCWAAYSATCGTPAIVRNSVFEDIEGSGNIESLPGDSILDGLEVSNSLFFCTDGAHDVTSGLGPQCGASQTITDNVGNEPITNAKVTGNTFYNLIGASTIGLTLLSSQSTGASAHNNFVYGGTGQTYFTGPGITEDYNTVMNNPYGYAFHLTGAHDFRVQGQPNPFVNTAAKDFRFTSDTAAAHLNDGTGPLAAPNDKDLLGVTRGVNGFYDRGAYQFPGAGVSYAYTSVASLVWSSQHVGVTATPQVVTLYNTGSAILNIASIVATGAGFGQTSDCGATLTSMAYCTITVSWTPVLAGTTTGAVTFTTDSPSSPDIVTLSGSATITSTYQGWTIKGMTID